MEQTIMSEQRSAVSTSGATPGVGKARWGDKLSSGEALGLLSGHWQHPIAVGKVCREKHRPGGFGRQAV